MIVYAVQLDLEALHLAPWQAQNLLFTSRYSFLILVNYPYGISSRIMNFALYNNSFQVRPYGILEQDGIAFGCFDPRWIASLATRQHWN